MLIPVVWLVVGLILLVVGADLLVRGASRFSLRMGLSPLVVGLTIVAFGTSAPEFVVSLKAALMGQAGMAVGNVVGSNIFNILGVLGLCAAIAPLIVHRQVIVWDVPLMLGSAFLFYILTLDGSVDRFDGIILFVSFVGTIIVSLRMAKGEVSSELKNIDLWPIWKCVVYFVVGLAGLVYGGDRFVVGASEIARFFGVSDLLIGLTVVAVGTSLPELAASVVAVFRGETDMAVGNVVGSNIFNILGVMGLTALVSPDAIAVATSAIRLDIPIMIAASLACLPIFFKGHRIARWEGLMFIFYYVIYTVYLILSELQQKSLQEILDSSIRGFILPLTIITIFVLVYREAESRLKEKK